MITRTVSVVRHRPLSVPRPLLLTKPDHLQPTIRNMLAMRRNCVAGDGDTPQCCATRGQLLKIHADMGWTWPALAPSRPVAQGRGSNALDSVSRRNVDRSRCK